MDTATSNALLVERENLSKRLGAQERSAAAKLRLALPDWRWPAAGLGEKFISISTATRQRFPRSAVDINKLVVVELALKLPETLVERNLAPEVLSLYPAASKRLLAYLQQVSEPDYCYPNDSFVKDLRFGGGLSVPCGAQDVDLRSVIGYRASARCLLWRPSARFIWSALGRGQIVPWFRIHTDSRNLGDFNESGWDACYLRIAALLRRHVEVLGMAGTSWFYDPQLEQVSPRLSYLRTRPVERGAFILRSGTLPFDIQSATATSESRRRLYREGKYLPVSYTLLWPRAKLLAWAEAYSGHRKTT